MYLYLPLQGLKPSALLWSHPFLTTLFNTRSVIPAHSELYLPLALVSTSMGSQSSVIPALSCAHLLLWVSLSSPLSHLARIQFVIPAHSVLVIPLPLLHSITSFLASLVHYQFPSLPSPTLTGRPALSVIPAQTRLPCSFSSVPTAAMAAAPTTWSTYPEDWLQIPARCHQIPHREVDFPPPDGYHAFPSCMIDKSDLQLHHEYESPAIGNLMATLPSGIFNLQLTPTVLYHGGFIIETFGSTSKALPDEGPFFYPESLSQTLQDSLPTPLHSLLNWTSLLLSLHTVSLFIITLRPPGTAVPFS